MRSAVSCAKRATIDHGLAVPDSGKTKPQCTMCSGVFTWVRSGVFKGGPVCFSVFIPVCSNAF